ncbi:hypothetical protein QBZ16_002664 [Prototheca wickerhamii]|uniref:Prephenate/arogenate dehydrogenase domain-containing protein n=1 Tax=Prototheca wickerhamii TaxID=3111 RepID=A0AAD9MHR4_PROWI|nr:hypothetical protein QBZ16_002664 [Prototheca wickerhamii]
MSSLRVCTPDVHLSWSPFTHRPLRPACQATQTSVRVWNAEDEAPCSDYGPMHIGILGFGTFGRFLAERLVKAGHHVTATSRTDYAAQAQELGVTFFNDVNDFCEDHPEIVILATSILSFESVLEALPVQRLKRSTLFVDVLSVKEFPRQVMRRMLPAEVDILCTHPMFGPDSGKGSWAGLNFMYEIVRVGDDDPRRKQRIDNFIRFFAHEGCSMVEMSCREHDTQAASTQFLTHTIEQTPIDTRGFQALVNLMHNTTNDSFDLYYGLFLYNPNAIQELERLEHAFDSVKRALFKRLHDRLRQELFYSSSSEDEDATLSSDLAARVTQAVELVRGAATSTKPL